MENIIWVKQGFIYNTRQATCLKDEVLKFQYYDDPYTRYYLLFWMNVVADLIWLFRSFYLRRSSVESFVERDFFISILFQVYFDFA